MNSLFLFGVAPWISQWATPLWLVAAGVTLGALSVDKRMASSKRHPTLDDRVVVYANATILGGDTVIGAGSVIGGNVWLTQSVPVNSIVTPTARVDRAKRDAQNEEPLDFNI